MTMRNKRSLMTVLTLAALLLAQPLTSFVSASSPRKLFSRQSGGVEPVDWINTPDAQEGFVIYEAGDEARCRPATPDEAREIAEPRPEETLHVIASTKIKPEVVGGINITLRSTAQLDSFPDAKAAFLRAAQRWTDTMGVPLITGEITIIVDVDFGTTRFGTPYPPGVIGATGTQTLFNPNGYPGIRTSMIGQADDASEGAIDNALPASPILTDLGGATAMAVPSATLRCLRQIGQAANPPGEPAFGSPPSIGFNSGFTFDFDPSNGIDSDKIDFDAVATHEIGHALGFTSRVGVKELSPGATTDLSAWDLFRFRPTVTAATFSTATRILSSGGDQVFFTGTDQVALSTGRPDGSGGDGFQSSHWRDNTLNPNRVTIGIMDPAIARGERNQITANDILALNYMGYRVKQGGGGDPPTIGSLSGNLVGDRLTLMGSANDVQGDFSQAQVTLLDANNSTVRQDTPVTFNPTGSAVSINIVVTGLISAPTAFKASLVLIDGAGNRSVAAVADFSQADTGGATIRKAIVNSDSMVLKGDGFVGPAQIEVNGLIISPPNIKVKGSGAKIVITGTNSQVNIHSGSNRVREIQGAGLKSNIVIGTP